MIYGRKQKKRLCIWLAVIFALPSIWFCQSDAFAAEPSVPAVHTIDIGIRPSAYRELISNESEPRFSVQMAVDEGDYFRGQIKLRGNASKGVGLLMPTKRIPIQLASDRDTPLYNILNNSRVKLINSLTPFRLLAEYMALDLYAFAGIPAPAHEFVFLRYNDVDFGLYIAVEDVNGEFLAKNFPDGNGSLFKESQKDFSHDYSISNWFGSIDMVVDRGDDRIMELLDALDRGEGYETLLDVDEFLRFFACLAVWGANSSFLTEQNNFFLYDTGEKFILLPWDNSDAFGAVPSMDGIDHYRMNQWEDIDYPPPVFTLLMEDENNREKYHAYIRELNEAFLAPARLEPYFNELAALVQPYLERDPTILINPPYSVPVQTDSGFGTVGGLLETLGYIYQNLYDQLDGKTDCFYYDPVYFGSDEYPEGVMLQDDFEGILSYYIEHTPNYDPEITDKICNAYSDWGRQTGRFLVNVEDPVELVVSTGIFLAALLCLIVFVRKNRRNTA